MFLMNRRFTGFVTDLFRFIFFPVRGKKYEPDRSDSKSLSLTLPSSSLVRCPLHARWSLTPVKSKPFPLTFKY